MQDDDSPNDPPENRPSEGDVQFAVGIIMVLMVLFIAGFVMLMISMASDMRSP